MSSFRQTPDASAAALSVRVDRLVAGTAGNLSAEKRGILKGQILSIAHESRISAAVMSPEGQARAHLEVVRDFREEFRFLNVLQEDLRRERAVFFTQTIRDAALALKESGISEATASTWLEELVLSYTASLDVSAEILQTAALEGFGAPESTGGAPTIP